MHHSTLLRLTVVGGLALHAVADNAHLKVQFFSDANCKNMKADNERNPSDLNPSKNECERPDHHLPGGGFPFRSIKYWFVGDDWEDHKNKYRDCNLYGFNEKKCEDDKHHPLPPNWVFESVSFFDQTNTTECHTLTNSDNPSAPFFALKIHCKKDKEESKDYESLPVAVHMTAVTTTQTYVTDGRTTEGPTIIPISRIYTEPEASALPATVVVAPTLTKVVPYSSVVLNAEATVNAPEQARRPLHARDVTAKSAASPPHTAVIGEQEVYNLIQKMGQDLAQWIADLDSAAGKIEDDTVLADCNDFPCGNSGDDVWPDYGDSCSEGDDDTGCGGKKSS